MRDNHFKAIIFDLGNVLIDFDHTIAARKISSLTTRTPKEIFNLFFDSELTGLFEEGKISPRDFHLEVKKTLNLELNYADFIPIWNEIFFFTEKNRAVYNLARTLKSYYKTALLSNINILHFEYLKNNFPIFDAFHHIIVSFEVGLKKPNPLIYQKALGILGVLPQEVFYTDDRAELVKKASELGITSFCFEGIDKLNEDLSSAGINKNKLKN